MNNSTLYICSTGSNKPLFDGIVNSLKANEKSVEIEEIENDVITFKNGEIKPNILKSVRKKDVVLISSLEGDINSELVKTLFSIDALHRAGAARIELWQPFYFYGRQDKTGDRREPVSAAVVARMYEKLGVNQFVTLHIHNEAIEGFFDHQFDKIGTQKLFWNYLEKYCIKHFGYFNPKEWIINFPDEGAAKNARNMEKKSNAGGHAGFSKYRSVANEVESVEFFGDVKDMNCLLFDDMIDTGGTIVKTANELKNRGSKLVMAACTHPLLNGKASTILQDSSLDKIFVTDNIFIPESKKFPKLEIVPTAPLFSACILTNHLGGSLRQENW